jgi:hypothetical protein
MLLFELKLLLMLVVVVAVVVIIVVVIVGGIVVTTVFVLQLEKAQYEVVWFIAELKNEAPIKLKKRDSGESDDLLHAYTVFKTFMPEAFG